MPEIFKKKKIPITFITNDPLTAKLSLLLPALITSTDLLMLIVLDLIHPERETVFRYLKMLNKFSPDSYPEIVNEKLFSTGVSYMLLPLEVQHLVKQNLHISEDATNNFIRSTIINLLLCLPEAVFFLFSYGKGLLIKDYETSHRLAKTLVGICKRLNVKTTYMIIHLDQPLGSSIGGRLELKEVFEASQGKGPHDLLKLGIEISTELMLITNIFKDKNKAKLHIKQQIINGNVLDRIKKIWGCTESDFFDLDLESSLPSPRTRSIPFLSPETGFIQSFPKERILNLQETLLHRNDIFGVFFNKKTGKKVFKGEPLASIYFIEKSDKKNVLNQVSHLFNIEPQSPDFCPLIIERYSSY